MSVIYRERDREWDDSRTSLSTRRDGAGYTTVKRYRIGGEDDTRSTAFDRDRRDTRVEETRIIRREREPSPDPPPVERKITIRREREREEPRIERDIVIRREREVEEPRREYRREEPVVERDLVIRRREEREEPRYEERDVTIRRWDDRRDYAYDRNYDLAPPQDLTRYSKSTEYFSQPQQPQTIIIRNEPIIIRERVRDDSDFQMVRREDVEDRTVAKRSPSNRDDGEYFYERRVQETRDRPRDRESEHYERNRYRRDVSPGDSISQVGRRDRDRDYSSDDSMVYVRKEVKETDRGGRDRSESPYHRRHVAEGALAGIGVAELLRHHSKKQGKEQSGPLARIGKDVGGGVLGMIAAEGVSRARSRMRSKSRGRARSESRNSGRSRRRSRSESRSKLKTLGTVGLGAAALAVAAAVARNRNKSSDRRSRSRHRRGSGSDEEVIDDARSPSHRNKRMAEAGLAGAAVAGIIKKARSMSQKRNGDERSRSRLRAGLPIAVAGLGSAALAGIYERNKAKKEEAIANAERKSRSRSRSRARSTVYAENSREAGLNDPNMIEYGNDPISGAIPQQGYYGQPAPDNYYDNAVVPAAGAAGVYGATRGERSRSRSRSRDRRSLSSGSSDGHGRRRRHRKHSSRSQSRDLATAGVAAAGGALAASEYQKRKERKRQEKAERKERRRQEAEQAHDQYEEGFEPAPFQQQGGEFYPQANTFPPPPGAVPQEYPSQSQYTAPQPTYNTGEYHQPAGTAPQADHPYGQQYPATPAVDPYAGRPQRGDENVSAEPPSNTNSFPNENYETVDGVNTPRAPSPAQHTGPTKTVKFTPSVISDSSPDRRRHSRRGEGNNSYEADDSDTTLDDDDRRRSNPRSTFSRRPTGLANGPSATSSSAPNYSSTSSKHASRHERRDTSPIDAPSPAPSDETIELPERFDERGRRKPDHEDDDPIANLVENLLNGKGFMTGEGGDAGEGSSRRDRRRR